MLKIFISDQKPATQYMAKVDMDKEFVLWNTDSRSLGYNKDS